MLYKTPVEDDHMELDTEDFEETGKLIKTKDVVCWETKAVPCVQ